MVKKLLRTAKGTTKLGFGLGVGVLATSSLGVGGATSALNTTAGLVGPVATGLIGFRTLKFAEKAYKPKPMKRSRRGIL